MSSEIERARDVSAVNSMGQEKENSSISNRTRKDDVADYIADMSAQLALMAAEIKLFDASEHLRAASQAAAAPDAI
ncbi:MAG: hypothetical protein AAF850_11625 [Pseudomonadota bacterium]